MTAVNHLAGLEEFVRRWDTGRTLEEGDPSLVAGELGNINREGSPSCGSAVILTRWHPRFRDSLEPGVRDLVLRLVDGLGCITYSSCQGHPPAGAGTGLAVRHAGILPRDPDEQARLLRILRPVAAATRAVTPAAPVHAVVHPGVVTTEGPDRPCIDVAFVPAPGAEDHYFRDVDRVYGSFLRLLAAAVEA